MFARGSYGKCFGQEFLLEVTHLLAEGRAVGGVYFGFTIAFNTVSQSIPTDKLMKYNLNKWAVKWMKNWLNSWVEGSSSLMEHPGLVLFNI